MRDWQLKTFDAHHLGIQKIFDIWPKESNHVFKEDKYYSLLIIYIYIYIYIYKTTSSYIEVYLPKFVHYHLVITIKKGFLKKKRKRKRFLYFYDYTIIQASWTKLRKKEPCKQGCSWIIKFSHWLNFGYLKYGIIFWIWAQNDHKRCMHK